MCMCVCMYTQESGFAMRTTTGSSSANSLLVTLRFKYFFNSADRSMISMVLMAVRQCWCHLSFSRPTLLFNLLLPQLSSSSHIFLYHFQRLFSSFLIFLSTISNTSVNFLKISLGIDTPFYTLATSTFLKPIDSQL